MSLSITTHECSNSTRLFTFCRMVLNKFKAISVWSDKPGLILGCLVTGTVMRDKDLRDKVLCFF
jgi:hypothetical protein